MDRVTGTGVASPLGRAVLETAESTAVRPRQLMDAHAIINERIDQLERSFSVLYERIEPALRPLGPQAVEKLADAAKPSASRYVEDAHAIAERVATLDSMVRSIADRLQT